MITKSIQAFCPNITIVEENETQCGNFIILPSSKCYPIYYKKWKQIFQKGHKYYVLGTIEESKSYCFHVWNAERKFDEDDEKLKPDSIYMELAKKYCPKVHEIFLDE